MYKLLLLDVDGTTAEPEVRAVADWVAPSLNDDGVAAAIEKYILNPYVSKR